MESRLILKLRTVLAITACVFLIAACGRPAAAPADAAINGVTQINRQSGQVNLSVSAFDRNGDLLTSGNITNVAATVDNPGFSVTPGVCGPIVHKGPLSVVLLLDNSGSMTSSDPGRLRRDAAKSFVNRMGATDRATIARFAGTATTVYHGPWFSSDRDRLATAIDSATSNPSGGTPLFRSAHGWINLWRTGGGTSADNEPFPEGNKAVLIFTDGADTSSGFPRADDVRDVANANGVTVHMVGLGSPNTADRNTMMSLATGTGGIYGNTRDPVELESLFVNALHASRAGGCIDLQFSPVPTAGTSITGSVKFSVNGTAFQDDYTVEF